MIISQKGFSSTTTLVMGALAVAVIFASVEVWYFPAHKNPITPPSGPIACTTEAKLCPDGSYVGRTGPQCEFAACPRSVSSTPIIISASTSSINGWKMYTNEQYGFDFKYPHNWTVQSKTQNKNSYVEIALISPSTTQGIIDNPNTDFPSQDGLVFVDANPKNLSMQEYYTTSTAEHYFTFNDPILLETSTPIGGILAKHIVFVGGIDNFDETIVPHKDFFLRIQTVINSPTFQQILATVHFIRGAGAFCGGIATGAFPCDPGYSCKLDGTYPDAGGHCVVK